MDRERCGQMFLTFRRWQRLSCSSEAEHLMKKRSVHEGIMTFNHPSKFARRWHENPGGKTWDFTHPLLSLLATRKKHYSVKMTRTRRINKSIKVPLDGNPNCKGK
jgi:hypothetical protein